MPAECTHYECSRCINCFFPIAFLRKKQFPKVTTATESTPSATSCFIRLVYRLSVWSGHDSGTMLSCNSYNGVKMYNNKSSHITYMIFLCTSKCFGCLISQYIDVFLHFISQRETYLPLFFSLSLPELVVPFQSSEQAGGCDCFCPHTKAHPASPNLV